MLQAAAQILLREFRAVNSFRLTILLYIADNASARRTLSPEPSIWIIVRGRSSTQGETTDLKHPKQLLSRPGTRGWASLTSNRMTDTGSSKTPTCPSTLGISWKPTEHPVGGEKGQEVCTPPPAAEVIISR